MREVERGMVPEDGDFFVGRTESGGWVAGCRIEGEEYTSGVFATEAEADEECSRVMRAFDLLVEERTIAFARLTGFRAKGFESLANACVRANEYPAAINFRNTADQMWGACALGVLMFLLTPDED